MKALQLFKNVYRRLYFNLLLHRHSGLSTEDAYKTVYDFHPQTPPVFCQSNTVSPEYDLMIIVPVYNVEKYLERCISSVINQKTGYTYQAVFIDDGSTDSSPAICDKYSENYSNFTVIHKENGGLSSARNLALQNISGKYVMFLDSDDYLPDDAVEKLVGAAVRNSADIVVGSFSDFMDNQIIGTTAFCSAEKEIPSAELPGFSCGKAINSRLLENFCFPVGYIFEDTVMAALLYPECKKVTAIPDVVYFYRNNPSGITASSKGRHNSVDTFYMMKYCLEERIRRGHNLSQDDYVRYLISVRRNHIRMCGLPDCIQESVFMLTCQLFGDLLPFGYCGDDNRMKMLEKAIKNKSFDACQFLMDRWDIF